MPPRLPPTLADALARSGARIARPNNVTRKTLATKTTATASGSSALPSPSSARPATFTSSSSSPLSASRSFTCSSCLSRQQQQSQPQSQSRSSAGAAAENDAASYAEELQRSTPAAEHEQAPVPQKRLPRWAATPAGMRAPFSVRKNEPANRFAVNEDPARLDRAYVAVFGDRGADLLPAEVKWLAVTHKSFDQGRRGFNDRLSFIGKRIVDLQTSLAVLAQEMPGGNAAAATQQRQEGVAAAGSEAGEKETDKFGREIFDHPVMKILPKLTPETRREFTDPKRMALLAQEFALQGVVRWKPRSAANLMASGMETVLAQTLYAMIGALALHQGGDVATKAVRTRILPRLGLKV